MKSFKDVCWPHLGVLISACHFLFNIGEEATATSSFHFMERKNMKSRKAISYLTKEAEFLELLLTFCWQELSLRLISV